jgi:hypothetical protein
MSSTPTASSDSSDLINVGNGSEDDPNKKIILKFSKLTKKAAGAAEEDYDDGASEASSSNFSGSVDQDPLQDSNGKSGPRSRPKNEALSAQLEELFATVMTATDSDGRELYGPFRLLPSKKMYPSYYVVIKRPIDLKT